MAVYGVSPAEAKQWASHSLRVGACVILHLAGFYSHQIKFDLRWNSDTFMDYLRDVVALAHRRNDAMMEFDPDQLDPED